MTVPMDSKRTDIGSYTVRPRLVWVTPLSLNCSERVCSNSSRLHRNLSRRNETHTKAHVLSESTSCVSTTKLSRQIERQLFKAIDRGLASLVGQLTPRRYVEWMTTSSSEIGRVLKRSFLSGKLTSDERQSRSPSCSRKQHVDGME